MGGGCEPNRSAQRPRDRGSRRPELGRSPRDPCLLSSADAPAQSSPKSSPWVDQTTQPSARARATPHIVLSLMVSTRRCAKTATIPDRALPMSRGVDVRLCEAHDDVDTELPSCAICRWPRSHQAALLAAAVPLCWYASLLSSVMVAVRPIGTMVAAKSGGCAAGPLRRESPAPVSSHRRVRLPVEPGELGRG